MCDRVVRHFFFARTKSFWRRWACNANCHEYGIIVEGKERDVFRVERFNCNQSAHETEDKIVATDFCSGQASRQSILSSASPVPCSMPLAGATPAKSRLALLMIRALRRDLCHLFLRRPSSPAASSKIRCTEARPVVRTNHLCTLSSVKLRDIVRRSLADCTLMLSRKSGSTIVSLNVMISQLISTYAEPEL